MRNKRSIDKELSFTRSLKMLVESKQELSIIKIQVVKNDVIKTRKFAHDVSSIAHNIKQSYYQTFLPIGPGKVDLKELLKNSVKVEKGSWISVLITPNESLYGSVVYKIFEKFMEEVQYKFSEIVIIGALGKRFYEQSGYNKNYHYFELPDGIPSLESLQEIVNFLYDYYRVDVYYGRFINLVDQEVIKEDINSEKLLFEAEVSVETAPGQEEPHFLFEPQVKDILGNVEGQLLGLFFKQAYQESYLAQLGSRITAMEIANDKIDEQIALLRLHKLKYKKAKDNREKQQRLAGMSLWRNNER